MLILSSQEKSWEKEELDTYQLSSQSEITHLLSYSWLLLRQIHVRNMISLPREFVSYIYITVYLAYKTW